MTRFYLVDFAVSAEHRVKIKEFGKLANIIK